MIPEEKKIERMVQAARLYYEQELTQNEIAKIMGISRPLVSNLLTEARACGIVSVTINAFESKEAMLAQQLCGHFGLTAAVLVPDGSSQDQTDRAVAAEAYRRCFEDGIQQKDVGIGWGSMMGRMADHAETAAEMRRDSGTVFPLIGGIRASYRGYHTNEIIRILSVKTGLEAEYLYSPAIFDSQAELDFFRGMANSHSIEEKWRRMDLAVVGISNYPSYPDLGVKYRYGSELTRRQAVGRLLAHYYDIQGKVIEPGVDNAFQIPVEQLRDVPQVTALCSSILSTASVLGALRLGVIKTLILPCSLGERLLSEN